MPKRRKLRECCKWHQNEDGQFETACKQLFEFNDGPRENNFRFCPYCGKRLVERKKRGD